MDWQTIRELYPSRWLIVEAIDAYTEGGHRVIPQLKVVGVFEDDWHPAWELYKQVHHEDRWREYYMLHTDREELNIGVMDAFGRVVGE
jgi:hypothetical protein